jgi:hypothetical protein
MYGSNTDAKLSFPSSLPTRVILIWKHYLDQLDNVELGVEVQKDHMPSLPSRAIPPSRAPGSGVALQNVKAA